MTRICRRMALAAVLLVAMATARAVDAEGLRIVAPTNQSMPLLRMTGAQPVDGLLKDIGEFLAARLGLSPSFIPLPSKRAGLAVASGAADLLCYVKPGWLDGKVLWTRPFLSGTGIIAAHPGAPPVTTLYELRDEPLGTVLGYRYPVLDEAFMQPVRRKDVPDATTNLRRLALGRIRYAVTDRAALDYFLRENPAAGLREAIEVERYQLSCALSPDKAALLAPLNHAIDRMQADGTLEALFNRYR
ncbi:MAG TPA: transporter substrate-binding domain-containing protein [Roseateles sp.]